MATHVLNHTIDRLPLEILQNIFMACCYVDRNDEGYNTPHSTRSPVSLSHVSRMWRQIAILTPELWSRLHVEFNHHSLHQDEEQEKQFPERGVTISDVVKKWIHRARASGGADKLEGGVCMPVHLSILDSNCTYPGLYDDNGCSLALWCMPHLHSLVLDFSWPADASQITSFIKNTQQLPFPATYLRQLELRQVAGYFFGHLVNSAQFPNLKEYRNDRVYRPRSMEDDFAGDSYLMHTTAPSLAHSITDIDISQAFIGEEDVLTILRTFTALSSLRASINTSTALIDRDERTTRSIKVPSLCRICFRFAVQIDAHWDFDSDFVLGSLVQPTIFDRLLVPNLVALETSTLFDSPVGENTDMVISGGQHRVAHRVFDLVQYSGCALQELVIQGWQRDDMLNGTRVLELACSIPTLRKLVYDGPLGRTRYCTDPRSVHRLHVATVDEHPLLRVLQGEWEFVPHLEELECAILVGVSGTKREEEKVQEELKVIERRMKSSFGQLKFCQLTVIRVGLCGPDSQLFKAVLNSLDALTPRGLTYKLQDRR